MQSTRAQLNTNVFLAGTAVGALVLVVLAFVNFDGLIRNAIVASALLAVAFAAVVSRRLDAT